MFYENENEKDVIGNNSEIQITEDGVVSWGDVLDDTSDDLVSVVDDGDSADDAVLTEASEDEIHVEASDEPDEEELRRILSDGDNAANNPTDDLPEDIDLSEEEKSEQDFEFDSSMMEAENFNSQDVPEQEVSQRKAPQKSSVGLMPVLLALLVAVLVVGAGYFIYLNMFNNETSSGDLTANNQINDITEEELAQRAQQQEDIPVVNEDTQDMIQADDAQAEEKKEVVSIKLGGRANPFLPNSKYISVDVPETYIDFENPSIPKPPETYGPANSPAVKMLSISVSGIMYDNVKPSAIITYEGNDYFVQRGDKLNEYRVIDIGPNFVLISLGRNTYKANVGEEFKITDDFYGSAKYLPTGRQYQIVGNKGDSVEIKVD